MTDETTPLTPAEREEVKALGDLQVGDRFIVDESRVDAFLRRWPKYEFLPEVRSGECEVRARCEGGDAALCVAPVGEVACGDEPADLPVIKTSGREGIVALTPAEREEIRERCEEAVDGMSGPLTREDCSRPCRFILEDGVPDLLATIDQVEAERDALAAELARVREVAGELLSRCDSAERTVICDRSEPGMMRQNSEAWAEMADDYRDRLGLDSENQRRNGG